MLHKRQKQVLLLLLENKGSFLSSQDLARYLACSDKTIQNDIHVLEDVFKDKGLYFEAETGQGYQVVLDEALTINDMNALFSWLFQPDNDQHLIAWMVTLLLLYNDYVTRETLILSMYLSEEKLDQISDRVEEDLRKSCLKLVTVPGQGYLIEGHELSKRYALLYYGGQCLEQDTLFSKHLSRKIQNFQKIYEKRYHQKIMETLQEEPISLVMRFLRAYLYIAMYRYPLKEKKETLKEDLFSPRYREIAKEITNLMFEGDRNEADYLYFTLNMISPQLLTGELFSDKLVKTYRKVIQNFFKDYPLPWKNISQLQKRLLSESMAMFAANQSGYRMHPQKRFYQSKDMEYLYAQSFALAYLERCDGVFYREDIARVTRIFNIALPKPLPKRMLKVCILYRNDDLHATYLARKLNASPNMMAWIQEDTSDWDQNSRFDYCLYEGHDEVDHPQALGFHSFLHFSYIENVLSRKEKVLLDYFKEKHFYQKDNSQALSMFLANNEKLQYFWEKERRKRLSGDMLIQGLQISTFYDQSLREAEVFVFQIEEGLFLRKQKVSLWILWLLPDHQWDEAVFQFHYQLYQNKAQTSQLAQTRDFKQFREELADIVG